MSSLSKIAGCLALLLLAGNIVISAMLWVHGRGLAVAIMAIIFPSFGNINLYWIIRDRGFYLSRIYPQISSKFRPGQWMSTRKHPFSFIFIIGLLVLWYLVSTVAFIFAAMAN